MSSWWTLRNWSNQAAVGNITFCHPNFITTVLFAYSSLYFLSWATVLWCWTPLCCRWISECTYLCWCLLTDTLFCKMFWDQKYILVYFRCLRSHSSLWELYRENNGFPSLITGQGLRYLGFLVSDIPLFTFQTHLKGQSKRHFVSPKANNPR